MQTVSLKANDWDVLFSFIMEVGKNPQKVSKSFPDLSWRALNKLDAVANDIELLSKTSKDFFQDLEKKFTEMTSELKTKIDEAQGEEKAKLQIQLVDELKKFRQDNRVEEKEKEVVAFEFADDKFEMIKKLLDDHAMEMFIRREPLNALLPAFGLTE